MAKIIQISGPTLQANGMENAFMHELALVGEEELLGEVIRIEKGVATLQMFEETVGLRLGDGVRLTEEQLSVELGPGLLGSIYDGVQRPLPLLAEKWGDSIARGARAIPLDREKRWRFTPALSVGEPVSPGVVIGSVQESTRIEHRIMTPPGREGRIAAIAPGDFCVTDAVATLEGGEEITMLQKWSVHTPRPMGRRLPLVTPLVTGQRILDTLFPIAEGGAAIIPGGFGTGKTVLEHAIAKFSNADIIVYVGCGERGNEMASVLTEFPELIDPHTGAPLMERTILIANTSNMPVAAREASIYTGMTLAEYYRDMGYRCALMADSTSRWAEALREISSRLEEMPGEEGYPTYLPSRLGALYERAGRGVCLGREEEQGSVSMIGAVSPPGGDFSEPVTQSSLRISSTFWALDYDLAHQRHFPAVDWLQSYSLTAPKLADWFCAHVHPDWTRMVEKMNRLLQREKELNDIIQIVGLDSLGDRQRVEVESARILREGYLRQSSYHPTDAFCSLHRQALLLETALRYCDTIAEAIGRDVALEDIIGHPLAERVVRLMEVPADALPSVAKELREKMADAFPAGGGHD